jgi:hypothetical protein
MGPPETVSDRSKRRGLPEDESRPPTLDYRAVSRFECGSHKLRPIHHGFNLGGFGGVMKSRTTLPDRDRLILLGKDTRRFLSLRGHALEWNDR